MIQASAPRGGYALGATVQGAQSSDGLMPQSLGIETKGGVFTPLIERGTPLPAQRSEIFTTADSNQTSIKVTLLQGDDRQAARNTKLGVFELSGIAPRRREVPQIMVAFDVDFTGITVSAVDLRSGKEMPVTVSGEIETW